MTPRARVLRPTLDTPFHIDFEWWQAHDRNWHLFLRQLLCPEHQEMLRSETNGSEMFDWVDPETAEVYRMDRLQYYITSHCAKQPDFLRGRYPLVERAFRLLLAHGNTPMTPRQMAEALGVPPTTLLRVLASPRVYRGIRPVLG